MVGGGALAYLFGNPKPMPSATRARDLASFDCTFVTHAVARVVGDRLEPHESPLAGVRFELDDLTHQRLNIAEQVVSGVDGTAVVEQTLPGCPEIELRIRAFAPPGFVPPVQQTTPAPEGVTFTFARVR
jgi:hypothetical protein